MIKQYRLLAAGGKVLNYASREARDSNAQRVADETGAWVGLEVWEHGDWWLEREVQPARRPHGAKPERCPTEELSAQAGAQ